MIPPERSIDLLSTGVIIPRGKVPELEKVPHGITPIVPLVNAVQPPAEQVIRKDFSHPHGVQDLVDAGHHISWNAVVGHDHLHIACQ